MFSPATTCSSDAKELRGERKKRIYFFFLIVNYFFFLVQFFDTTPVGRIINRMSKDINLVDQQLPMTFRFFFFLNILLISLSCVCVCVCVCTCAERFINFFLDEINKR